MCLCVDGGWSDHAQRHNYDLHLLCPLRHVELSAVALRCVCMAMKMRVGGVAMRVSVMLCDCIDMVVCVKIHVMGDVVMKFVCVCCAPVCGPLLWSRGR